MDTIRRALAAYRELARSHRYGGLGRDYKLAKEAIAELERVEKELKERQMRMKL